MKCKYLSMIRPRGKRLQHDRIFVYPEGHRHFSVQLSSIFLRWSYYWRIGSCVRSALAGRDPRPNFSFSWLNNTVLHLTDLPGFDRLLWLVFQHSGGVLRCCEATSQHRILGTQPKLGLLHIDNHSVWQHCYHSRGKCYSNTFIENWQEL